MWAAPYGSPHVFVCTPESSRAPLSLTPHRSQTYKDSLSCFSQISAASLRNKTLQFQTPPNIGLHNADERRSLAEDHGLSGKSLILLPKRVTEI